MHQAAALSHGKPERSTIEDWGVKMVTVLRYCRPETQASISPFCFDFARRAYQLHPWKETTAPDLWHVVMSSL